ncbi:MAG: hypothetical protein M3041_21035 [Acidobacteriota bacterium]|nr:hypothetical protein [Acidobacteriota bacterium]
MGKELVRSKGVILCVLLAATCKPVRVVEKKIIAGVEPQMAATVITVQTSLQPQRRIFRHSIVIANGHARSSDEIDRWRLFDLEQNRVTYVNDVEKTYYSVPFKASDGAQFTTTGAKRPILGVEAAQYVIRLGGFQRELWIGAPPQIPPKLFGMIDADFAKLPGFPMLDHAELPYGKTKMILDRSVLKIEQRLVPQSSLNIPADYKEITAPGARRPPASSPPPDRNTPAAE